MIYMAIFFAVLTIFCMFKMMRSEALTLVDQWGLRMVVCTALGVMFAVLNQV